jgi:hypothetical protein
MPMTTRGYGTHHQVMHDFVRWPRYRQAIGQWGEFVGPPPCSAPRKARPT